MWKDHEFTFTATIHNDCKTKKGPFGNSVMVILKTDPLAIKTKNGKSSPMFFMGTYNCPPKKTSFTDDTCLPFWIKKGQKVIVKGRINGSIKENEKAPSAYFLNFSEVIPVKTNVDKNTAVARGEVVSSFSFGEDETLLLLKEQVKKTKPTDPVKYRYYRVLSNQKLSDDSCKPGTVLICYGQLGRDCLPIPAQVAEALKNDPNDKGAKYHSCFAPLIVANQVIN